ncbi:hypothetical protein [Streptomyces orinoci]|uniref:Uncharacterized protein n=1 Tax=Streptomyces orinoci TaxID=67339 RepID=A0ABV3K0Z0_STRON|nr:hypothetical protein [Streptomyces orinoci]
MTHQNLSDAELIALDVPLMIRYGVLFGGAHRTALFGDGAVAAALAAEREGVLPRSLRYLGEVVRRAGLRTASGLPEPLPGRGASVMAQEWLATAASVAKGIDDDETMARWLEAVATVLVLRASEFGRRS